MHCEGHIWAIWCHFLSEGKLTTASVFPPWAHLDPMPPDTPHDRPAAAHTAAAGSGSLPHTDQPCSGSSGSVAGLLSDRRWRGHQAVWVGHSRAHNHAGALTEGAVSPKPITAGGCRPAHDPSQRRHKTHRGQRSGFRWADVGHPRGHCCSSHTGHRSCSCRMSQRSLLGAGCVDWRWPGLTPGPGWLPDDHSDADSHHCGRRAGSQGLHWPGGKGKVEITIDYILYSLNYEKLICKIIQ